MHSRTMRVAAVFLTAIVACNEPTRPTAATGGIGVAVARPTIADGANGANPHFFFLPPMVAAPQYSGVSDGDQSPTVVVCEWNTDGDGSCGRIVAQFDRGDGTSSGVIRYDATAGHYIVNWKTTECTWGACTLDANKHYRLRVLVGAYQVGFADLDVVNSGGELKNVQTGEYIGLVEGRTLPVKFRLEQGAVATTALGQEVKIGVGGGAVATEDGAVALTFPAGALRVETAITVKAVTEERPGVGAWGTPMELGPNGTTFDRPVTLTMSFDGSQLPPGVTPSDMGLYTWAGDSWVEVAGSVVNAADNTISSPIEHFSEYYIRIRPNSVTGWGAPLTMLEGATTTIPALVVERVMQPATYCYQVRVRRRRFLFFWSWVWQTRCTTISVLTSIPAVGERLNWGARNTDFSLPALAASIGAPGYSIVGVDGFTNSPPITAVAPGQAVIEGQLSQRTANQSIWPVLLTVVPRPVAVVSVSPPTTTLARATPAATQQLTATVTDAGGIVLSGRTITWRSSDDAVATVSASGLVTAAGAGSATITATCEGKSGSATIVVTPGGYTLVFSAQPLTGEYNDLYTQATDGSDASRIRMTTDPADDQSPRWSPDARRMLFTSQGGGGSWELFVMDATAGAPRRQVTVLGLAGFGDLSPTDPSTAVFMYSYRIWTMNIDAPNPQATAVQLTNTAMDDTHPRWSPDGRWIAFVRHRAGMMDVWVLNAADPTQAFQVTDLGDYARYPSWSPDGTKIVFERLYDIYVADVIDRSDPARPVVRALSDVRITRLTFDGAWNDMPVWSPDGRKIVWAAEPRDATGQRDLFMMNTDGSGVARVTFTRDIVEQWPAFRPRVP